MTKDSQGGTMQKEYFVYELRPKRSGRSYIGYTADPLKRWKDHRNKLKRGAHHSLELQESWNRHRDIEFNILSGPYHTEEDARDAEDKAILAALENGTCVNLAVGGNWLVRHPRREEIIRKSAETNSVNRSTPKARERFSKTMKEWYATLDEDAWLERRRVASETIKKGIKNSTRVFTPEERAETLAKIVAKTTRPISLDGVEYPSVAVAAEKFGLVPQTIRTRINGNDPRYAAWVYLKKAHHN